MIARYINIRRNIFQYLGKISFGVFGILYIILYLSLVSGRVGGYERNPSALIGIHKMFADANPKFRENNFIVYENGGYDGQFFFLIAKYLYQEDWSEIPILDSFRLRFTRIGMPILSGFFGIFLGFDEYPIFLSVILIVLHVLSAYLFKTLLPASKRGLYLLYLFSPFTINSDLLLVSDGLFAACFLILIYILGRGGVSLSKSGGIIRSNIFYKEITLPLFMGALFFLSIRETSLPFFGAILLFTMAKRHFFLILPLCCALGIYLIFFVFVARFEGFPEGTNPLSFLSLSDFPIFGFIKSISIPNSPGLGTISRELIKFPLFFLLISLGLCGSNSRDKIGQLLYLPIYFIVILGTIAEQGYWNSFDNSSRFFTLAIPYVILISGRNPAFRFFGLLEWNLILFLALIARFWFIKEPMAYHFW